MIVESPKNNEEQTEQLVQKQSLNVSANDLNLLPVYSSVKIDMERMQQAIAGKRFVMPQGLSREQMREHILTNAKNCRI